MSVILLTLLTVSQPYPELAEEDVNAMWRASRIHDLPRIFYFAPNGVQGRFLSCEVEIGPQHIRRTNAGMEFPWRNPGGRGDDGRRLTIKSVYPPDIKAKIVDVRLKKPYLQGPTGYRYNYQTRRAWQWPKGSAFFELHYHPKGHSFELRCLIKTKDGYGFDNYEVRKFAPKIRSELKKGEVVRVEQIRSTHPINPFSAKGEVYYYDDVDIDWKTEVLKEPWEDVTGSEWHHAGKGNGWVTPKNYFGFITGSKHEDCAKCHESAGIPNENFEFMRDWYGNVPGADGIFRFDPVDRRTVRPNGQLIGWKWRNN